MILMYICICSAITDKQIKTAVANGASTLEDLQFELGVAINCGRCAESAMELLPVPEFEHHLHATEITRSRRQAANDTQLTAAVVAQ
ncbi:hypothetical protein GCM10023337_16640 [Paenalcaligenes hermetiae]|uniref:Bacterioferritin-associated ferredoxin n=2 Tax=Alcaligenaceae TaxID=506 RepID=A0ABP9M8M9_9BURK